MENSPATPTLTSAIPLPWAITVCASIHILWTMFTLPFFTVAASKHFTPLVTFKGTRVSDYDGGGTMWYLAKQGLIYL